MNVKKFYFLIAAEVMFVGANAPDQMQSIRLNGVVSNEENKFPAAMIGRGQQVAQMHFFNRMGEHAKEVEVKDVVLINVTPLGEFTEEEFNFLPTEMRPPVDGAANDTSH